MNDTRHVVTGVTTYNRLGYLRSFVETWDETRSRQLAHTLIIADDGSCDGTVAWIGELEIEGVDVIKIFNKGAGIAGQSNSILEATRIVDPSALFCCNDDVVFAQAGWDTGYLEAMDVSGYSHLVFFDDRWKPALHDLTTAGGLRSQTDAEGAMGAFWTLTPDVLEQVGFFDEVAFPHRGHSHIDFTVRACRVGANNAEHLMDWSQSTRYLALQPREGYEETFDWNSTTAQHLRDPLERERRWGIIRQPDRVHVQSRLGAGSSPLILVPEGREDLRLSMIRAGFSIPGPLQPTHVDTAFILNLPGEYSRFVGVVQQLVDRGLWFERFPAVDGREGGRARAFEAYSAQGPVFPVERAIHRRLIESAGGWGYLHTALRLLDHLRVRRMHRAMTFDDDVIFAEDATERLRQLAEREPRIGYLGGSRKHGPEQGPNLDDPRDGVALGSAFTEPLDGSFALLLSGEVLEPLMLRSLEFKAPFDSGPMHAEWRAAPDEVHVCWPPIVIADVSTSSIRAPRDMEGFSEQVGWDLERFDMRPNEVESDGLIVVASSGEPNLLRRTLWSLRMQTRATFRGVVAFDSQPDDSVILDTEADGRFTSWVSDGGQLLPTGSGWRVDLTAGDVLHPEFVSAVDRAHEDPGASLPVLVGTTDRLSGRMGDLAVASDVFRRLATLGDWTPANWSPAGHGEFDSTARGDGPAVAILVPERPALDSDGWRCLPPTPPEPLSAFLARTELTQQTT